MTTPTTRILLADDHQLVREGLRALLKQEPGVEVIGEAKDGTSAVELAEKLKPDLVLMDLSLEGLSGFEATKQLREKSPQCPVLVVSMHREASVVDRALRSGARGYVLKGGDFRELVRAIQTVIRGELYLSPELSEYVLQGYLGRHGAEDHLSEREREVLELVAEGFTSKQIAERLGLKPKTVENHRANIMQKLGIHTTAGLVRYALRKNQPG
ncbi:MAG: response regulator [Myxococcaceae bacterium]